MDTNRNGKRRCESSRAAAGTGSLGRRCSGGWGESMALLDYFLLRISELYEAHMLLQIDTATRENIGGTFASFDGTKFDW